MKIKLYFDKGNLGRLAVAMIFAAVLFWKIGFSVWALPVFGACYFLFKSLEVELSEKIPWVWTGLMIGASSIFTAYHVQYLLLDAELRAKVTQPKMLRNILCCLVVFLAVQVFTNNTGLTCMISHIFLVSLAGINYFVYLFRGNEFIFSDLKSIQTGLSVAGNYEFVMDDRAGYVILISTLYVALIRKLHVSFKKRVPMAIICISLAVLSGVYIGHKTEYIVTETWEQKGSYRNGYILNFVLSVRDCFIAAPDGYSSEAVKALEEQYSGGDSGGKKQGEKDAASAYADVAADPGEKPAIIVVMSESYADLSVVGDFFHEYRCGALFPLPEGEHDSRICAVLRVRCEDAEFGVGVYDREFHGISAERFCGIPAVYFQDADLDCVQLKERRLYLCGNASVL